MKKIIRACTVSQSVGFVAGMLPDLMKKYEVVLLSSPGPEMDAAREKYGVRTIEVPMERHISLKRDIISLWRMIKVFRKEKPDMVHSMTPKAGMLCMLAGWLTRVPVRVHTFTGLVFPTATGLKRRILMATDALTCFCATHIIPEGEGVKADLLNNGITRKPMKVLGYGNVRGIDLDRFSIENGKLKIENCSSPFGGSREGAPFIFLFVGRIVRDKGINELMEAFQKLSEKHPDVRLLLVGPYEDGLDPISQEARDIIANNKQVEAVGPKRGDDLLAYYAAADCFVFPSYREGFPNTVLEAGAMGLPCIVTDINGSREIITNGSSYDNDNVNDNENGTQISRIPQIDNDNVSGSRLRVNENENQKVKVSVNVNVVVKDNGMIIPSKDAEALYEAMEMMMMDEEMRQRMVSCARQMIADRFEQGFVRKCLYDFYDTILGR